MEREARYKRISFWVDKKTFENLEKQRELSKICTTNASYLTNLINSRAKNKDLKLISKRMQLNSEILLDMYGIATNINQIAHALNRDSFHKFNEEEFYSKTEVLTKEVQEIIIELKTQNSYLKGLL
ncbi:MobC family plasmid mobilization relaxosome protein (plasmid) [Aliarcobacter butzleri]|uniref:MobC family plasmid mobilization relaxosome protein n=1 Tax=Aliarcobacter butzleri TaxID=28197 RepID=UPI0021B264B8|nr:MobC family plasmid mobilization relaxosome protein [Aliarcobacter butzleri]UXC30719.1 MobC family plasmid mobilization relaxosome protein [Aliarcobacter butzleri]